MSANEILPDLFRTEYSKLVAVLCRSFGFSNIQVAEDIVSDTFLQATETWEKKGVPDNQAAWLYTLARNRALDYVRRQKVRLNKVDPALAQKEETAAQPELDLSHDYVEDSQLRMIFAVCHPSLDKKSQVILALRFLCGFGIDAISAALLTSKDTINKRLYRAKKNAKERQIEMSFPQEKEIPARLDAVLRILYLLFNEGYYSSTAKQAVQKDLCLEAMRLTLLLAHNERTHAPRVDALLALMCFHASRFEARADEHAEIVLYADQNRDVWEEELIRKGEHYLNRAATGMQISPYHLQAAIAYWHTQVESTDKWENILMLYNQLLQIEYTPHAALNRTYALARARGGSKGIKEALKLGLEDNHFYHCLLAELYEDKELATHHLEKALELCDSDHERTLIQNKLEAF